MANVQLLDGLAPVQLLELMARLATNKNVDLAALRRVTALFEHGSVTLVAPIVAPLIKEHATYDRLLAEYKELPSALEPRIEPAPPGARPLADALLQALLMARNDDNPANQQQEEFLLVAYNFSQEKAIEMMQLLRGNATGVTMASAQNSAGRVVRLYHVLSDPARRSTFLGAYVGGQFGDARLLYCYTHERRGETYKVFLPRPVEETMLDATALRRFSEILLHAAPLLGLRGGTPVTHLGHRLLAAVEDADGQELRVYPLAALHFLSWEEIAAAPPPHVSVRFCDLSESEDALPRLRDAMRQAEPFIGYRLQLLPMRFEDDAQKRQEQMTQIHERKVELEEQLAVLESLHPRRPLLLRFTQRQLPALADVLRRYPADVLRCGALSYGFQANADHPLGQHFIYARPDAPQAAIGALCAWSDYEPPPMRFWLDPFWAGHYHDGGNQALIFAPDGLALYPTLHSWSAAEMDAYLMEMVRAWYAGQPGDGQTPTRLDKLQQPIYLFEQAPSFGHLRISVLDLTTFRPLHTQLAWLNDNLIVYDELDAEGFIHELAEASVRKQLLQRHVEWAGEAHKIFAATEQNVRNALAAKTRVLTEAMTAELDALIQEVQKTLVELSAQRKRLGKLRNWAADMGASAAQLEALIAQVDGEVKITDADTANLRELALAALRTARSERARVEQETLQEIQHLQAVERDLMRRLEELRPAEEQYVSPRRNRSASAAHIERPADSDKDTRQDG